MTANAPMIEIYMDPSIMHITEIRVNTVSSLLSHFGGIYGLLVAIYVLLFGVLGESPWGFAQKIRTFNRDAKKLKAKDDIEGAFGTLSGVPLAGNVIWPDDSRQPRVDAVAERLEKLEMILSEFYLDTKYLEIVAGRGVTEKP